MVTRWTVMEKEHIKNRQATEQLLLEAVNRLVEQDGFEGLGINAVAAQAGVSKMLIYRYFGSLNGLIAAYIRQYDFWINVRPELPGRERLGDSIKELFRQQIAALRNNYTLRRLAVGNSRPTTNRWKSCVKAVKAKGCG